MRKTFLLFILEIAGNSVCQNATVLTCEECMALDPTCVWCADPLKEDQVGHVNKVRCRSTDDRGKCTQIMGGIENHERSHSQKPSPLKQALMPKEWRISLRRNDPINVTLSFTRPEYANIDLFYLLDLSRSMREYLKAVKRFFVDLVKEMRKFAIDDKLNDERAKDQFRIGFGSFVDRPVAPFFRDLPQYKLNPCVATHDTCKPTFTYNVDSKLSSNIEQVQNNIKIMEVSENIDAPEASLDAILQTIQCKESPGEDIGVGWQEGAFKLLVVTTDNAYKAAGDGLVGGLFAANDGQCHKKDMDEYEVSTDYPSIGQIYKAIEDSGVGLFFLTPEAPAASYGKLASIFSNAGNGTLPTSEQDFDKAVNLIAEAYEQMAKKVLLRGMANPPSHLNVKVFKKCTDDLDYVECLESTKCLCDNVEKKETVHFKTEYNWAEDCGEDGCDEVVIDLKIFGTVEESTARISFQNTCPCDDSIKPSYINCENGGNYHCGNCICPEEFDGEECQCAKKTEEEDLTTCAAEDWSTSESLDRQLCSGKGVCNCGKCKCNQYDNGFVINGDLCECDSKSCPNSNGKECSGNGKCNCQSRECECGSGWTGEACDCTRNQKDCLVDGEICAGNGVCTCGECTCTDIGEVGYYDPDDNCKTFINYCDRTKDCALCLNEHSNETPSSGSINIDPKCGQKCPEQTTDLEKTDGHWRLNDFDRHYTNQTYIENYETCQYQMVFGGKTCTLYAFIGKDSEFDLLIGKLKCINFPINALTIGLMIFAAFLLIGIILLIIASVYIKRYKAEEVKKHEADEMIFGAPNPIYKEPETQHHANTDEFVTSPLIK